MRDEVLTRQRTLLLAVICGVTTANAYYAQPLLDMIANDLHATTSGVSLIITMGQIGNALGLVFIVPAADIKNRRAILTALFAANTLALGGSVFAPNASVLCALAFVIGIGAVAIPTLSAYAAALASDDSRGRALGTIMGGVLFGILLSRTVSSLIAAVGGWRSVYVVAAVIMAMATLTIQAIIGSAQPALRSSYGSHLVSVVTQFREHAILRERCAIGACVMATFTAFWTSVAFLLARPPFSYSQIEIGVFALSGVAGALMASFGGKYIDRYRYLRWQSSGVALLLLTGSFGIMALGKTNIGWLVLGAVVMDAAIQAVHVTNQSVIYEVDQRARARLASGYMTCFAIGGAAGATASAQAYVTWGWYGSCCVGAVFGCVALVVWLWGSGSERVSQNRIRSSMETSISKAISH